MTQPDNATAGQDYPRQTPERASRRSFARGAVAALAGAGLASLASTAAARSGGPAQLAGQPLVGLIKPGGLLIVDTIADMQALPVGNQRRAALVLGSAALNDGGGGIFYWDPASSSAPDGGTVFASGQSTAGRWIRLVL